MRFLNFALRHLVHPHWRSTLCWSGGGTTQPPVSRKLLTEQQLKGLLAELRVLEAVALLAPENAIKIWTGADQARHDFTGLAAACEVKASTLADEIKIHVNGLNQLTEPPGSALFLLVERFERVPAGGDSLPEAVHRLEGAGIDRHAILTAIAKVGAQPADFRGIFSCSLLNTGAANLPDRQQLSSPHQ